MKEKVVCGNLYQLADSVRLATPLARFGKVVRTASKQSTTTVHVAFSLVKRGFVRVAGLGFTLVLPVTCN